MTIITNMTDRQDASHLLRAIRARLGLTQEQLAERLGGSVATVNRWEGGMNTPQRAAQTAIVALAEQAGLDAGDPQGALPLGERVPRRRRHGHAPVPSTKTVEQMLWDAACSIRGEEGAAKVKDYLLALLFLKR